MANEWPMVPLGELVDPTRGISYGIVQPGQHVTGGVPIIRVSDLRGDRIDASTPLCVSAEIEASYSRTRLRGGELVMSIVGTVGQTAIIDDRFIGWNTARAIAVIPVRDDVGAYWVKIALRAPIARERIFSRLNTTVQATLNLRDVSELPITLPPANERKAMMAVLGALDAKIELKRRMNETLEATARAIFKDWFVDFGPTRAKQNGHLPYLPQEIWSLFPDCLDGGGRPEGWNVGTLADLAYLNNESWSRANFPDSVKYVDLSNTKWGTIESVATCSRETAPSRAQRILRPGDTIIGTVRPGNGSYAFISTEGLTGSTAFAVLRPKKSIFREAIYFASTSGESIDRFSHLADGGAYPAVRPELISATEVVTVPETLMAEFSSLTSALLDRADANKRAMTTLATTRDFLLPKLISGEVRVGDAASLT